jgi:hypothetical protein
MDRLEKFNYLMGVIEDWAEETPDRYGSTFRHLQEGAAVRELVVTPGFCISVQRLKTFLALGVLEIYPSTSASNVSWLNIRRDLAGEAGKKYSFYYDELEKCFSAEANRQAAKNTQLIGDNPGLTDEAEGWEDVPLYLLEKLQEKFRKTLGEYWHLCAVDVGQNPAVPCSPKEGKTWKDEYQECEKLLLQKRDKYMECLMALALHELFVKKYSESWSMLAEEAEHQNEVFQNLPEEMEEVIRAFGKEDGEGKKKLVERARIQAQKSESLQKWYKKFMILGLSCLEHNISLGAEIQIVMLLEKKRLEEMDYRGKRLEHKVGQYLTFMEKRLLSSMEVYNKNKKKCYQQLEVYMKDVFVEFINSIPWESQQDITQAVKRYMEIVEQGRGAAARRKELWYAQSMIAAPLIQPSEETA